MNHEIDVSVFCMAFNHEAYLRDTLEGLLHQDTDLRYEVLVHDDASSDGTAAIMREYAEKYPDIIIPIYQTQNQYSQGVNILSEFFMPRFRGKYIAACEGDDYWIDPQKLNKQFAYMEAHPDCSFCFTNAKVIDMTTGSTGIFIPYGEEDKKNFDPEKEDYDLHDFFKLRFIPTASFFFKRADLEAVKDIFRKPCPAGDLKWRLNMTARGYAHFINEPTCVYRINVPGSESTEWKNQKRAAAVVRHEQVLEMLEDLDDTTGHEFYDGLLPFMQVNGYWLMTNLTLGQFGGKLKKLRLKEIFQSLTFSQKLKIRASLLRNSLTR